MNALVPYTTVPILTEIAQQKTLDAELDAAEQELVQVNGQLRKATNLLEEGVTIMNGLKADIVSKINIMDVEIRSLTEQVNEIRAEDNPPQQRTQPTQPNPTEPTSVLNRALKSACKALYRKIARVTHPDKTKDTYLNSLFQDAYAFLNANDLMGLEQIAKKLFTKEQRGASLVAKLRLRLKFLMADCAAKKQQLSELVDSPMYQWVNHYMFGDMDAQVQALGNYEAHLRSQMFNRQTTIHNLKQYIQKLNAVKEAKAGGYTVTITYTGGEAGYTYNTSDVSTSAR